MKTDPREPGHHPAPSFRKSPPHSFPGRLIRSRRAASAVEYTLLVALIGVSILAATMRLGTSVQNTFNNAEAAQKSGDTFNVL